MTENINAHVLDGIAGYLSISEPGFALLITGEWGSGKTYLASRATDALQEREPERPCVTISLFGLQSAEALHDAVLAALAPSLEVAKQAADFIEPLSKKFLGLPLGGIAKVALRKQIKPGTVLVFDDLERARMDRATMLGAINLYLEHHKCSVIALANEDAWARQAGEDDEDRRREMEKLFARRLRVRPDADTAFDSFAKRHKSDDGTRYELIRKQRKSLLKGFRDSGSGSLRVLRRVIDEWARIGVAVTPELQARENAFSNFAAAIAALTAEIGAGTISGAAWPEGRNSHRSYFDKDDEKDPASKDELVWRGVWKRHKESLHFLQSVDDSLLARLLIEGETPKLGGNIQSCGDFIPVSEPQAWRRMLDMWEAPGREVEAALEQVESTWLTEQIPVGVALHLFSIRLALANHLGRGGDVEMVTSKILEEIAAASATNRLPPISPFSRDWLLWEQGYGRIGYLTEDATRHAFGQVSERLETACGEAYEPLLRRDAKEAFDLLQKNYKEFFRRLEGSSDEKTEQWYQTPILAHFDPEAFATALEHMTRNGVNALILGRELNSRWQQVQGTENLRREEPVLRDLAERLQAMAQAAEGLDKIRLSALVPNRILQDGAAEQRND